MDYMEICQTEVGPLDRINLDIWTLIIEYLDWHDFLNLIMVNHFFHEMHFLKKNNHCYRISQILHVRDHFNFRSVRYDLPVFRPEFLPKNLLSLKFHPCYTGMIGWLPPMLTELEITTVLGLADLLHNNIILTTLKKLCINNGESILEEPEERVFHSLLHLIFPNITTLKLKFCAFDSLIDLQQFADLTRLENLDIHFLRMVVPPGNYFLNFGHLKSLSIRKMVSFHNDHGNFRLPSSLEHLRLETYTLDLPGSLTSLYICRSQNILESLQKLSRLESLTTDRIPETAITTLKKLKILGPVVHFPSHDYKNLRSLHLVSEPIIFKTLRFDQLEMLSFKTYARLNGNFYFGQLKKLSLGCPLGKLKISAPQLLHLKIENLEMEENYNLNLDTLNVEYLEVRSLSYMRMDLKNFYRLKELRIDRCQVNKFPSSLEGLTIIRSSDASKLPTGLSSLHLELCSFKRRQKFNDLTQLKTLYLKNVDVDTTFPSSLTDLSLDRYYDVDLDHIYLTRLAVPKEIYDYYQRGLTRLTRLVSLEPN